MCFIPLSHKSEKSLAVLSISRSGWTPHTCCQTSASVCVWVLNCHYLREQGCNSWKLKANLDRQGWDRHQARAHSATVHFILSFWKSFHCNCVNVFTTCGLQTLLGIETGVLVKFFMSWTNGTAQWWGELWKSNGFRHRGERNKHHSYVAVGISAAVFVWEWQQQFFDL